MGVFVSILTVQEDRTCGHTIITVSDVWVMRRPECIPEWRHGELQVGPGPLMTEPAFISCGSFTICNLCRIAIIVKGLRVPTMIDAEIYPYKSMN